MEGEHAGVRLGGPRCNGIAARELRVVSCSDAGAPGRRLIWRRSLDRSSIVSAMIHSRTVRLPAVLGAMLVLATLAACGDRGATTTATRATTGTRGAAPAGVDHVRIEDFKYVPSTITVAPGTTITWTNRDKAPHTATSGASPNADGVFESGTITKGASRTVTVSKRGTFAYYCAFHPFMKGTVIVK